MPNGDARGHIPDFVLVDGGTTNTRAYLVRHGKAVATAVRPIGVRNTAIVGDNRRLVEAVASAIAEVAAPGVDACLCVGMITSPLGLFNVPHLRAPVGVADLAQGIQWAGMPDIPGMDLGFVPGVKTLPVGFDGVADDPETLAACDFMRGEETQAIGLARLTGNVGDGPFLAVVLGSHTKFILVDGRGRVVAGLTTLAGELMEALKSSTILAGSLPDGIPSDRVPDYDTVRHGADAVAKHGFGRAAFTVRLADQLCKWPPERCLGYLSGAIAAMDIEALGNWALTQGVQRACLVGGPYRVSVMKRLLEDLYEPGMTVSDDHNDMKAATIAGAVELMGWVTNAQQGEDRR